MPTLRISFPAGRYHATPVGHHVNEGQIEWPPSPWRLLRALIASGFNTQHWLEIPDDARRLFEKLAAATPSYRLPQASAAHSRHYMPIGSLDKGREKTTLVFDTWANVGDGVLQVHWDCDVTDDERQLLAKCAECLNYLGRSESWVEAELVDEDLAAVNGFDAFAHQEGMHPGPQWEQVSLMGTLAPETYRDWRQHETQRLLAELPLPEGKKKPPQKLLKERAKAIDPYPEDLLDCLIKDTAWWKQRRWSQAPGSQRVIYWRRADSLQVSIPTRTPDRSSKRITTMLIAITTASGNKSALPIVARTLPQAELFHRALVARAADGKRIDCPELTGRSADGQPLSGTHQHAHVLPLDLDSDGHLDHIIVHAPMGLSQTASRAIRSLRRTWTKKGGENELQLAIAGAGSIQQLASIRGPLKSMIRGLLATENGSRNWTSLTPFVAPRYLKKSGKNDLFGQVNAELASRGLPAAVGVEIDQTRTVELRHFIRTRYHGGSRPPVDTGYALRIVLAEPMCGPLALGYASHFGLGLFRTL